MSYLKSIGDKTVTFIDKSHGKPTSKMWISLGLLAKGRTKYIQLGCKYTGCTSISQHVRTLVRPSWVNSRWKCIFHNLVETGVELTITLDLKCENHDTERYG